MRVPLVDFPSEWSIQGEQILKRIARLAQRGDFILGQEVEHFEQGFAAYCGVRYGITVNSGTSALLLALWASGIGPGSEVITTPFTFAATIEAIVFLGAYPRLVDIEPVTFNLDPEKVESAINRRTRAILPVHLYGHLAALPELTEIARKYHLELIEDACQAHGADFKNRRAGSWGDLACFSFYPVKNLGAWGEGGIVVTNRQRLAKSLAILRNHGATRKYFHTRLGLNLRMETIQAAVLNYKLSSLEQNNQKRRFLANRYKKLLAGLPLGLPEEKAGYRHVYHQFVVRVRQRDKLRRFLQEKGIATAVHYPLPLHRQPAYRFLGYRYGSFPLAERAAEDVLSLPLYPTLSREQLDYVVFNLKRFW